LRYNQQNKGAGRNGAKEVHGGTDHCQTSGGRTALQQGELHLKRGWDWTGHKNARNMKHEQGHSAIGG